MPEAVILVVDDEGGVIQLCRRLLERAGYQTIAATHPQEALAVLENTQVDLLLADIRMPGMDGFQLIERAHRNQPDLAIVVMTGFGTVETAIEALRKGANGLILKPFAEGNELVETIELAYHENQRKRDFARLKALRPLLDLSEALFTEMAPNRLQDLIVDAICEHLECQHAGLYTTSAETGSLELSAWCGAVPAFEKALPHREADLPQIVGRRSSIEPYWQELLEKSELESLLIFPVWVKGVRKMLLAARSAGESAFRRADLELFVLLSRQAAVAMENAQLYAELRASLDRFEESQRALINAEKLAAAGRLTASIAHEINNPLQSVHNCLHLATRPELTPGEQNHYLELAKDELDRLMVTVQRMLEFYRPGRLDRQQVDLNSLVEHVLLLLEPQLQTQHITVHNRLASNLHQVFVVGAQIQQVLFNLLINGMEAMPDGGEVWVETRAEVGCVVIFVEDSGPGIPADQREHIFEPFTSTKEHGTGLGLTISSGIIAKHGGQLELVPGRGQGACFRITLPIGDAE
ncbi:MAG TPA: response regulator [Anaerolineales bacterium]|nr:response regulator [Anaerolineales bacterium]